MPSLLVLTLVSTQVTETRLEATSSKAIEKAAVGSVFASALVDGPPSQGGLADGSRDRGGLADGSRGRDGSRGQRRLVRRIGAGGPILETRGPAASMLRDALFRRTLLAGDVLAVIGAFALA